MKFSDLLFDFFLPTASFFHTISVLVVTGNAGESINVSSIWILAQKPERRISYHITGILPAKIVFKR